MTLRGPGIPVVTATCSWNATQQDLTCAIRIPSKGDRGATTLTALAEYGGDKVRRSLNLERAYLQGRFGAVPELDQFALRRALGLEASDAG